MLLSPLVSYNGKHTRANATVFDLTIFSFSLLFRFMFLLVYQCDAKAIGTHALPTIYFHCRFNILPVCWLFFSVSWCHLSPFSILRYSHLNVCVLDVCVQFSAIRSQLSIQAAQKKYPTICLAVVYNVCYFRVLVPYHYHAAVLCTRVCIHLYMSHCLNIIFRTI